MPETEIIHLLPYLDQAGLEQVASEVVMMAGLTPIATLTVPPPVDGQLWSECWRRGLDRIATLGEVALAA